jgi:L-arabinose isomerase
MKNNFEYEGSLISMQLKAKIGIIFLTSGWFRDVGLQDPSSDITRDVERIADEIVGKLPDFINPVYSGILFSEADAERAAQEIKSAEVHGLIIAPLMWCEDQILRAALRRLPRLPILLCVFFPFRKLSKSVDFQEMIKGSGSVGALQMSGFLKRERYRYQTISGYYKDPDLYQEIQDHCRSFAIAEELRNTRCGVLPFRCEQMSTTYVDEFAIRKRYGVELRYLEITPFREIAQDVSREEIETFKRLLQKNNFQIEVDEKNLDEGIKYSIAMEKVIDREGLHIFSMNDVIDEMHTKMGIRPCLSNPRIDAGGAVVSMEADIAAGIAMRILRLFTESAPFYTELFTVDLSSNVFLMGHAGYHSTSLHDPEYPVRIVADVEYENSDDFTGACTYFKYRPGPVTVVNAVYNGEKLQWVVFEGESLTGPPKLNGNCHLHCKVKVPVEEFFKRSIDIGVSQHFIVVPGHLSKNLALLCDWLDIEYFVIE